MFTFIYYYNDSDRVDCDTGTCASSAGTSQPAPSDAFVRSLVLHEALTSVPRP